MPDLSENASVGQGEIAAQACRRAKPAFILAAILLLALVLRLALLPWWSGQDLQIADETDYSPMAVHLVERGEFSRFEGHPCSARPPLYPAFVAAIYRFAGLENYQAVRIAQVILGLWLVAETFWLAKGMYDQRVALWAAGITALYPSLVGFSYLLLSEILFAALLLAALLALQSHLRQRSYLQLATCGVALGLATLTRSVLWPFVPLLAVSVFLMARGERWWQRLAQAATVTLAFILTLAPWAIRCTRLEQTFIPVDTLGGRNMMMGNYEHTFSYRTWDTVIIRGPKAWDQVLASEHPDYDSLTQGQRDKLAMRRGAQFALENPALTLKRDIVKFFNFWQLERTLVGALLEGRWGQQPKPLVLAIGGLIAASYAATMLLAVFGFVVAPPGDRRLHWFLLLIVGFICAVHTVVFAHERYRLSLMPLVLVYSGAAIVHRREIWQARRRPAFWIALTVSLILAASWAYEVFVVEWGRLAH